MADHNVKLNYVTTASGVTFAPDPNPIRVRPGQTINFQLGAGPANGKVRVTFADANFFSTASFNDGDGDVRVTAAPAVRTTYHCELLVDGVVKAQSAEHAGGDVIPDGAKGA